MVAALLAETEAGRKAAAKRLSKWLPRLRLLNLDCRQLLLQIALTTTSEFDPKGTWVVVGKGVDWWEGARGSRLDQLEGVCGKVTGACCKGVRALGVGGRVWPKSNLGCGEREGGGLGSCGGSLDGSWGEEWRGEVIPVRRLLGDRVMEGLIGGAGCRAPAGRPRV